MSISTSVGTPNQKFANLRLSERTHPALQSDAGLVVALMDLRLCGFYAERQWSSGYIHSESALARRMAEVCGGTERCHRDRLQKLKKLGIYSFSDGTVSINLDTTASTSDVEMSSVDITASTVDTTVPTKCRKTAGQTPEIGGTNSKNRKNTEQAATAAGAEDEGWWVGMATIGGDPDKAPRMASTKSWRSKPQSHEPVKRDPRLNDSPGNCHRCGKHLHPGFGELDGKNADNQWQIRCRIPCEDREGKKAALMAVSDKRQALVSEAAKAAPDESHKIAILELQSYIVLNGHRFPKFGELVENRRDYFTRVYGADAFESAVEIIRGIYRGTSK